MLNALEWLVTTCGRSAAFVGVAVLQTLIAYRLAEVRPDALAGYATVLATINAALFGGGALKAFADAKAALTTPTNGGK